MTVDRYERMVLDYEGPYLPIFASRNEYQRDEQVVWEGYDFNMTKNHRYTHRDWYFVMPAFLLERPWPAPRDWRWIPAIRVTKSTVREVLQLEYEYGGWPSNRRGHPMIPKKTGCSGTDATGKPGDGWARMGSKTFNLRREEQQEIFSERQD